jgi:hypothetical protein
MPRLIPAWALLALVGGCDLLQGETEWIRFNADDQVEVRVTADSTLGDPVETDLHSTTGAVVVGRAEVDPGSGPVGTEHLVTVRVEPAWADVVGKVVVRTDSAERGVQEADLVRDSADHGLWVRSFLSLGAEGEERTDTFAFLLWNEEDAASTPVDTGGDTGVR